MTTLPSTSSIRLPRPGNTGGQVLSMPSTQLGYVAPASSGNSMTPGDIWRVVRSTWLLIVVSVVVFTSIGAGMFYWAKATDPRYTATGLVQVNKPTRTNPTTGNVTAAGDMNEFNLAIEQKTQSRILGSDDLLSWVIANDASVRGTQWFKNFEAESQSTKTPVSRLAKDDLAANFRISPIIDSKLIVASMQAAIPKDARDIVEAVVNAHIDRQRKDSGDRTGAELEAAKQWRARYTKLMRDTKEKMNDLNARLSTGGSANTMGRLNIKEMEVSAMVGQLAQSRLLASKAAGELDALQQQIQAGGDPFQVEMIVKNDPPVARLKAVVDEMDLQLEALEQTTGSKSRMVEDIRLRRDLARSKLEKADASARGSARMQLIESAKSELSARKSEVDSLEARVDILKSDLGELGTQIADFQSLKDEYDGYRELERETFERVALLENLVRQQVTSVAWASTPILPDQLSYPKWSSFIPTAAMLGLALSLGIAFLREMMDSTVRSPRDISRVGPMNLLGMIARDSDDPQVAGVPLHMVISQAPHSMLAEQFRQVRTRLQHAASLDTTRTIVVTSAAPGDGKTTVATNLAAGLALNGRRILLVDANFRRPDLHKLFSVSNDVGFSNVLESVANLESAVKLTPIPNLELLTTGQKPGNPTELIEGQVFGDFIDRALEEYDHVIFDTGPLLIVSEAVALAPRVDGVITVVRAKKNTRGMLGRVRDSLKQIRAENLGVVINGVQTQAGGYYARNIKTYYDYQDAT